MYRRRRKYNFRRKRRPIRKARGFSKRVRRVIYNSAETKFSITSVNQLLTDVAAFRTFAVLNSIAEGTRADQRIGNKINGKSYSFDLQVYFTNTAADTAYVRAMVLYPRRGLSTTDLATYLSASNPGLHGRPDPTKYIVWYDQKFLLSSVDGRSGTTNRRLRFFKRMTGRNFSYDFAGTVDNQPILYLYSDNNIGALDAVYWNGTISFSYKDL